MITDSKRVKKYRKLRKNSAGTKRPAELLTQKVLNRPPSIIPAGWSRSFIMQAGNSRPAGSHLSSGRYWKPCRLTGCHPGLFCDQQCLRHLCPHPERPDPPGYAPRANGSSSRNGAWNTSGRPDRATSAGQDHTERDLP